MRALLGAIIAAYAAGTAAWADGCPGNPEALGVSRTIVVDPLQMPKIGAMQYRTTLPLADHEVVLTFDDGPISPYTERVLDALAAECVKATYFIVGDQAVERPQLLRRIFNAGHTIGTHTMHHPMSFRHLDEAGLDREVAGGIAAVSAAIGNPLAVAPFFRIPGLLRSNESESYLASKGLAVWSADQDADDWRHITAEKIVALAMKRIGKRGNRGVLLLHDIHAASAAAVPLLLKELKADGYRIVHAVPPGDRPASVPDLPAGAPAVTAALKIPDAAPKNTVRRKHAGHRSKRTAEALQPAVWPFGSSSY